MNDVIIKSNILRNRQPDLGDAYAHEPIPTREDTCIRKPQEATTGIKKVLQKIIKPTNFTNLD